MTLKTSKLRDAIGFALAVGALAGSGAAFAQDSTASDQSASNPSEPKTLDKIEVTGSRIRRVDAENASPVITIDRAALEKTGKLTVGDLMQELPAIAGAATNPAVNNGGGTGASTVDLRGLGSQRTLILVNGRRVLHTGGNDGGADVNMIPVNAIERVEVLTVGASSVYGSDAIGGVVNFIMRKDFEGMEASIDYGLSSRRDGQRQGGSFMFGQSGEKGNIIAGVNYNKSDGISAGDRDYSKNATYLYGGSVLGLNGSLGSSRNPRGQITLPATNPIAVAKGCTQLTLVPGASGRDPNADYRCYSSTSDSYNYQVDNLILTPQERTNAFFLGNYQMTDDTNAFIEYYHNKTTSNFDIAPLPFDAQTDGVVISADNYYNPFGQEFSRNPGGTEFRSRFNSIGHRMAFNGTTTDQLVLGMEGYLGDSWKWDFALNYGHQTLDTQTRGYVNYVGLKDALGPSFMDTDGVVKCGAPGDVIDGCTPLNIFNLEDPQTIATLQKYTVNPLATQTYVTRGFEANASGDLFQMPAGAAQLAFGAAWRTEHQRSEVEYVAIADEVGNCQIAQEACSSPVSGGFTVGELYGELFLPLLKDAPFAKALNVTVGSRYSQYDLFGNNTSSKIQIEWRPIDDLLLRGTAAQVFRAPSVTDLYAGPAGNAPVLQDRCVGYSFDPANPSSHDAACGPATGATNIPAGGIESSGLSQSTGVVSGAAYVGYDLKPEKGKSYDWGVVYDPSWLPGFSMSVDYWRLHLEDTITTIDAQLVLNSCYNDPGNELCRFVHRLPDGQIFYINQPTVNLGELDVKGWDLALRYKLPDTRTGSWNFGFDGTYLAQYDNGDTHVAGHFNSSYGMYSRVRGRLFADWSLGDWTVGWKVRYIAPFDLGYDIPEAGSADGGCKAGDPSTYQFCYSKRYGSYMVHSLNVTYALPNINSRIELGVDNVFDKQPPVMYQNNVLNANTDVNTFDTIGRYFFGRFTVKF